MAAVMFARSDDGERRQVLKPPTTVIAPRVEHAH